MCRHLHQVSQVAVYFLYLRLDARHQLVSLLLVEFQDALHLYFQQFQYVVLRHLAHQGGVVRRQSFVNMLAYGVNVGCLLKFLVLIDAFLDEYLLQRLEVQLLQQLALPDFQLLANQVFRAFRRVFQHIAHRQELWLVVLNHTAVGRYVDFAVREGIQRIQCLVARHSGSQLHLYLHLRRRQVFHVARLDFSLVNGFQYRVDNGLRRLRERNLANHQRLVVQLLYLRTYFQRTPTLSVVIFRHIYAATRGEVGV